MNYKVKMSKSNLLLQPSGISVAQYNLHQPSIKKIIKSNKKIKKRKKPTMVQKKTKNNKLHKKKLKIKIKTKKTIKYKIKKKSTKHKNKQNQIGHFFKTLLWLILLLTDTNKNPAPDTKHHIFDNTTIINQTTSNDCFTIKVGNMNQYFPLAKKNCQLGKEHFHILHKTNE